MLFPATAITAEDRAARRADVEVVKQRSQFGGSESTRVDSSAENISARDAVSLFNHTGRLFAQAMHIVVRARGTPVCKRLYPGMNLAC